MFLRIDKNLTHMSARQRGLAIIEFTIVLPILLVLLLAVAEIGRAFLQYNALTRAVRDSARYVTANALLGQTQTIDVSTTAPVYSAAQNLVAYGQIAPQATPQALLPGLVPGDITISNPAGTNDITVNVSYNYQPMLGPIIPGLFYGSDQAVTYPLQAQVTMKVL
jgi:Flp pilus assembly protein TadG